MGDPVLMAKLEKMDSRARRETHSAANHLHDIEVRVLLRDAILEQLDTLDDHSMGSYEGLAGAGARQRSPARTKVHPYGEGL